MYTSIGMNEYIVSQQARETNRKKTGSSVFRSFGQHRGNTTNKSMKGNTTLLILTKQIQKDSR